MNRLGGDESTKEKIYSVIIIKTKTMKSIYKRFVRRALLFMLMIQLSVLGFGVTYYVSNTGNDANSGLTTALPWKTIVKINSSTFQPGDVICFKKGDIWRDRLKISSSGSINNPITIISYGIGNDPVFSSPIGTGIWTNLGGGVYSCASFLNDIYSILWEDGKAIKRATTSSCLDGNWYHSANVLYYKPSIGIPTDHVFNYSDNDWGVSNTFLSAIDVSNRSYITISGIEFRTIANGIFSFETNSETNTITIQNCKFFGCHTGVMMMPHTNNVNVIISNNYFKWCQNGVRLYTSIGVYSDFDGTNNCFIYNNEMDEVGTIDGTAMWNYGTDYEAIGLNNVENSSIYGNYIHGGHQSGVIIFNLVSRKSENNNIYNNRIENNGNRNPVEITGEVGHGGFNNNWIYNNLIINSNSPSLIYNQGNAVSLMNYFINNTIIGINAYVKLYTLNPAQYLTIKNNIFYGAGGYRFRCDGNPTNLVMDYNLYYSTLTSNFHINGSWPTIAQMQGLGYDVNSVYSDPLFISTSDYHLQSGSPAINAGTNLGLSKDFDGIRISGTPDIGAFESNISISVTEYKSICDGTNYNGWTTTGKYERTLVAKSGSDSIVITYLTVNPKYSVSEDITINEGEAFNGWTESGKYTRNLSSVSGCDSIVTTNLTVESLIIKQGSIPPTHFIPVWNGENGLNHMNIMVVSAVLEDLPLSPEDEIAVFSGANCVGSMKLSETIVADNNSTYLTIPASQDDGSGNGFTINDTIVFKIWDNKNQQEMVAKAVVYRNNMSSWLCSGKYVAGATSVVEIVSYTEYSQTIVLKKGYNMISTFVAAQNPLACNVTQSLADAGYLIKLQDETGNSLEDWGTFGGWVNNIGSMKDTEGYKIKVTDNCSLQVTGRPIVLPLDIPLKSGWNIISFPQTDLVDAMNIIQPLLDQNKLIKVQDESGNSIEDWGIFGGWKNGIGYFIPGKAYKVKMTSDAVLTIQENYLKSVLILANAEETEYFSTEVEENGSEHMNINVVGLRDAGISAGDELAAFDGDICVGTIKITENHIIDGSAALVASFSSDELANDGFTEGHVIQIAAWNKLTGEESNVKTDVLTGQMSYAKSSTVLLKVNALATSVKNSLDVVSIDVFPNPSQGMVTVRFSTIPDAGSSINIVDISGRKVASRTITGMSEVFNFDQQPAGVYLVKSKLGTNETIHKLVIN